MKTVALAIALAGCQSALHEPPAVSSMAPHRGGGRSADELLKTGDAAWGRRAEPGQAAAAQEAYLDAAAADEHRVDGLIGAMRAISYRIEHESGVPKGELARREVELGQWCQRRAPGNAECDFRLAIALGQQARESPSTGKDAIGRMVSLLRRAIAVDPKLESGGPHRVLALVLLRAPSWPIGPGDPEAGLAEARKAVAISPETPDNQLVLGEALAATGATRESREAYAKALALATAAQEAGDPEAPTWIAQARSHLGR
jgi:tetratricopeptide (TPR) repeat protein